MDRWAWQNKVTKAAEENRGNVQNVRLYNGEEKTAFDQGNLTISTHRLSWSDGKQSIEMPLKYITGMDVHSAKLTKSAKLVLKLSELSHTQEPGPLSCSKYSYIKLSFLKGGHLRAQGIIDGCLNEKRWEKGVIAVQNNPSSLLGGGLVRIEQQIESSRISTDKTLNSAFQDIDALMEKAKDMVGLAERIALKLTDKKTEGNETVELKSHLLSIGISNPVTRDTHGTGTAYHASLGTELSRMLQTPLQEVGGVMSVSEVYCRYNRARGMELVSPEDVVNACKTLSPELHGMALKRFSSGVLVVEGDHFQSIMDNLLNTIKENEFCSAISLSNLMAIPLLLAKERLLAAEQHGILCRDETDEGIFFYENIFC